MNNKKQVLKAPQRRNLYISYLKEHGGEASTDEFIDYLKTNYQVEISRGTISEDRKYLEKLNYIFEKHNNIFKLVQEPDGTENFSCTAEEEAFPHLDRNLFLDWMILKESADLKNNFNSSNFSEELLLNDSSSPMSRRDIITRHLTTLYKQGYLKRERAQNAAYAFSLLPDASSIHCFASQSIDAITYQYKQLPITGAAASVLDPVFDFCKVLTDCDDSDDETASMLVHHGRQNLVPENITSQLRELGKFNFQENKLVLCYNLPGRTKPILFPFSIAVIFYSTETNRCYLLGESPEYPVVLCRLDRIDFTGTRESSEKNSIYNTAEWKKIYNEIYSASLDYTSLQKPVEVVVHFSNDTQNISDKVDALVASRQRTAHREDSEDQKTIIYTDTLRGLSSFAHDLRTFGSAARVEAPEELKELMLSSAQKVLARYEEVDHEKKI